MWCDALLTAKGRVLWAAYLHTHTLIYCSELRYMKLQCGRVCGCYDGCSIIPAHSLQCLQEAALRQYFEAVVLRNERPPIPPDMPEDYSLLMTTW
jgi:hypothetical protein